MQAIQSKFLPGTLTKPMRIKAWCARGSITVTYDYEGTHEVAHTRVVDALIDRFVKEDEARHGKTENPWQRKRVVGQLPGGDMAHVFVT